MAVNLSDPELFKRLQALGVDVGPINDATRDVYLRKYLSLSAQSPVQANQELDHESSPTTPPVQQSNQKQNGGQKILRPTTPPIPRSPHATPPIPHRSNSTCTDGKLLCTTDSLNLINFVGSGEAVMMQLLLSFDNPNHVASDTAFLFPDGEVLLASRSILATQCNKMIPMLYNYEGTTTFSASSLIFGQMCFTVLVAKDQCTGPYLQSIRVGTQLVLN